MGLLPDAKEAGCRREALRNSSSKPATEVSISSGATASPCTITAGGFSRPLAVGLENSSETRGLRRTLSAFWAKPMDAVTVKRFSSEYQKGNVGHVIGVPSLASVDSSHVLNSSKTSSTSGGSPATMREDRGTIHSFSRTRHILLPHPPPKNGNLHPH